MDGGWLVSYVALWTVVILQVILLLGLAREMGGLVARFGSPGALVTEHGLNIGTIAPDFTSTEVPSGRTVAFQAASGRETLLIFIAPDCGPCKDLLPRLATGWDRWQRRIQIHVICAGNESEVRTFAEQMQTRIPLLADPLTRIRAEFNHPPTPYAFLIDAMGHVKLKGVANSQDEIDRLIEGQARALGGREVIAVQHPAGDPVGTPGQLKEVEYGQVD